MLRQLRGVVRGAAERARHRRDYRALLQLEDHLLQDIGLPRAEIRARFHGEPNV